MSDWYWFRVLGEPVGKGRPRFSARGGRPRAYTPAKTRRYEQDVQAAAREAIPEPIRGPVRLDIQAVHGVPDSWPKWKREMARSGDLAPTGKPDASNVLKAIEDAINGVAWYDDAQVVDMTIRREYTGSGAASPVPAVCVTVRALARAGSSDAKTKEQAT